MSLVKIWVHAVWATKNREPMLTKKLRYQLFNHIRENALTKNIHIDFANGYIEHVHCLISLNPDQSIAKTIQLIKGESSFWINRNKLCASQEHDEFISKYEFDREIRYPTNH